MKVQADIQSRIRPAWKHAADGFVKVKGETSEGSFRQDFYKSYISFSYNDCK